MAKWAAYFNTGASTYVEIEVDDDTDPDEIMDALYAELPSGLCWSCSKVDIGDFEMDDLPFPVEAEDG